MAFTTKTIQMTDASGRNISPMVNLESLYYETENDNKIERHFIYENFPIYVNYGNDADKTTYNDNLSAQPAGSLIRIDIAANQSLKLKNSDEDIIVSHIKQNKIPGTNYYRIDVSNYNLSAILYNYESKSMADASIIAMQNHINTSINSINTSIKNCNTSINNAWVNINIANTSINRIDASISDWQNQINIANASIKEIYDIGNTVYTHQELAEKIQKNRLIPGHLYRMVYDPNTTNNTLLCEKHKFDLVLMADTSCSFSEDVVACMKNAQDSTGHFDNSDLSQWEVKYAFETKTRVTYLDVEDRFIWASSIAYDNTQYYQILASNNILSQNIINNNLLHLCSNKNGNYRDYISNTGTSYSQIGSVIPGLNNCGVIYYMKDEHGNEGPYDFKNAKIWDWRGKNYKYTFDRGGADDTVKSDTKTKNNIIKESPTLSVYCYSPSSITNAEIANLYVGYGNKDIAIYNSKNIYVGNNNTSVMLRATFSDSDLHYNSENTRIGNNNSSILSGGYGNEIGNNNDNINIQPAGTTSAPNSYSKFNRICDNNTSIKIEGNYNIINSSCNNIMIVLQNNQYSNNNILMGNNSGIKIAGNYNTVYANVQDSTVGPNNNANYVVLDKSNYSVSNSSSNSLFTNKTFYAKNYIKN